MPGHPFPAFPVVLSLVEQNKAWLGWRSGFELRDGVMPASAEPPACSTSPARACRTRLALNLWVSLAGRRSQILCFRIFCLADVKPVVTPVLFLGPRLAAGRLNEGRCVRGADFSKNLLIAVARSLCSASVINLMYHVLLSLSWLVSASSRVNLSSRRLGVVGEEKPGPRWDSSAWREGGGVAVLQPRRDAQCQKCCRRKGWGEEGIILSLIPYSQTSRCGKGVVRRHWIRACASVRLVSASCCAFVSFWVVLVFTHQNQDPCDPFPWYYSF